MTRTIVAITFLILGYFCWPSYETPYQVSPEIEEAAIRMIAEMRHE